MKINTARKASNYAPPTLESMELLESESVMLSGFTETYDIYKDESTGNNYMEW